MKKNFGLLLLCCLMALTTRGQEPEAYRENQYVNQVNREPMHTNFYAYESLSLAKKGNPENSAFFESLNGDWKFKWVPKPADKPLGFWKTDFDDSHWINFQVPGNWEVHDFGYPIYIDTRYAFEYLMKPNPPKVPHKLNSVGSYRKEIIVDKDWDGRDIYIHFDGIRSAFYVWVNGQWVGYSEDSKLAAEFNITKYLKPGQKNVIAFQVYRWSDGTYMEGQDMWRISGVSRDLYLYARPKIHLRNVELVPGLINNYRDGQLTVNLDFLNKENPALKNYTAQLDLVNQQGKTILTKTFNLTDSSAYKNVKLTVDNPLKWTAETPNLYKIYVTLKHKNGEVVEVLPFYTGFREVEVKNHMFLVNGKPVYIKGVNRHEMDPYEGQYVTRKSMERDIRIMKRNNINAVRTAHYPNDPYWYYLCDKYGIYLVDEANVESDGMGYGEESLSKDPEWYLAHIQRVKRTIKRDINHPSIVTWSLGNESGMGENFEKTYHWVKQYDSSRPVQYQMAYNSEFTDIRAPMYASPKQMVEYVTTHSEDRKPYIMCEYAHAMGNSMGNFNDYWDTIRKYYPKMQGGFIWDFADQSFIEVTDRGDTINTFGGDYGVEIIRDFNFNSNGLVAADRSPHPSLFTTKYYYQNIWASDLDPDKKTIAVFNEKFFTDLSNVDLVWELVANGEKIDQGKIERLKVKPQETKRYKIPYRLPKKYNNQEVFLNVYFKTKEDRPLIPADWEVAKAQFSVNNYDLPALTLEKDKQVSAEQKGNLLVVKGDDFSITFSRVNGFIQSYLVDGHEFMESSYILKPNFWRAPTDNDYGADFPKLLLDWKRATYGGAYLLDYDVERQEETITLTMHYDLPDVYAGLTLMYVIDGTGAIKVTQTLKAHPDKDIAMLPKFGMQMVLPESYNQIKWYGRGPSSTYWDRKDDQFVGLYHTTVADQYQYNYVRPQESGNKADTRWAEITNNTGIGLRITADTLFNFKAIDYLDRDLDEGLEKHNAHSGALKPRDFTVLSIDLQQMGLGGITSWRTKPLKKYQLPYQDYQFTFKIQPIVK